MQETILFEPHKTVALSKFHPELRFEFPDLPEALFNFALLRAARTLATDGKVIRRRVTVYPYPNVETYKLQSHDGMEICAILGIRALMADNSTRWIPRTFDTPDTLCECSRDMAWYDDMAEELHIRQKCGCRGVYFVSTAVRPADDACELPAEFYSEHLDLLLLGAKSRILRMNNKPWTNLQLATLYEKGFYDGIATAAVDAHTHLQNGKIKMQFGRII